MTLFYETKFWKYENNNVLRNVENKEDYFLQILHKIEVPMGGGVLEFITYAPLSQ